MRKLVIASILMLVLGFGSLIYATEEMLSADLKNQPWLGINLENSVEKKIEEIPNGALIKEVIPLSNAEKMGLKKGDIVKKVDETEVTSVKELLDEITKRRPNDEIKLAVFRNGETVEVSFQLENFHKRANNALEKLGFQVKSFSQDNLELVTVARINKGSYADYGGLNVNDLILALDHSDFRNFPEFQLILSNINLERPVDMVVVRPEENKQVIVSLKIGPEEEKDTKAKEASDSDMEEFKHEPDDNGEQ